ncbi:putative mitochondrial protein [Trifolium repens]|nr:putative mitochondrial protein [Trifolium repens]
MAESSNSTFVQPSIPKFDGHYDHWSMLMENFLRSKEYWSLIEDGVFVPPPAASAEQLKKGEESKLKDFKAKNYLFQAIDRTIMETILLKDSSKGIWDSMKQKYQGSTKVKRAHLQALRKELELLEMKDGETVDEYFARTLAIINKMKIHGERIEPVTVVEKILRSMTPKFNYVVCSIEESNDVTTLSIDELQSSLIVHEQRMKGQREEDQILKVTNAGRTTNRGRGRGGSRGGRGRGRQSLNKDNIECYHCHKLGHFQSECPAWDEKANYAEFDDGEEMLLMAHTSEKGSCNKKVWFLDSGCSNHMCGNKDWFFNLDEQFRISVKLGDNSRMMVVGKGNVKLRVGSITQVITNVYYIPELKNNLLSIGQLQEKGLTVVFKEDMCRVYHQERGVIMQSKMTANRMYVIMVDVITPTCFKVTNEDATYLWHCRYGHLSQKGLQILEQKNMVRGLPKLQESSNVCSDCMIGKQHREPFPKVSTGRATKRLQLIHADVCGPIKPESNSNKRYFLTFIDDFSRKTWVYFLSEKSSVLEMFKKFKAMVEKETSDAICCLRTDRGGEFTSADFNTFCSLHGIKRQLTAAYTPQQNGVAERKNRTIMNMVRSMLSGKGIPKEFWPEAVNWSVYVQNRSPTVAVKNMTPEEAWSGFKPAVHFFKVFGCIGYVHVSDAQRKKLDNKSVKCILLGISEESKAYKLYDPVSRKVIVSRDVVFAENEKWNWKTNGEDNKDLENLGEEEETESHSQLDQSTPAEDNNTLNTPNSHNEQESSSEDDGNKSNTGSENGNLGTRPRRPPGWLSDFDTSAEGDEEQYWAMAMFTQCQDPVSFEEAKKNNNWKNAMDAEIKAIEKNETWELTKLPDGAKKIGVKWVFKTKYNEKGEVDKYKARLVAKGYSQQYGIDYKEVFAPVARWDTIRTILALAALNGWCVHQLDVKSAFLHGELNETVFVDQPQGYVKKGSETKVYRLKKALYGLKQAPRAWYSRIESYFQREGFIKCPSEHTLFVKTDDGDSLLIVSLYVDDLIFTGNNEAMFSKFKDSMKNEFDMSDLGRMSHFLGVEVVQNAKGIFISQAKYARDILERFDMLNCNAVQCPIVPGCKLTKEGGGENVDVTLFKQIVGSLMYLTATRPDIMFAVCLISRYMEKPTDEHLLAAKKVLRYVKGTVEFGVQYLKNGEPELLGYTDSDYAGDIDDRKSTSGYVFMLGAGAISWSSKKQPVVTLSTTEAEFIAAASCACQAVWMRRILDKLGYPQDKRTLILCDNSSTIKLSKNPVMHGKSKHIDIRFHFLRDLVKEGIVELQHCNTQDQVSDIMTKPLKREAFQKLRNKMGVCKRIN